MNARTLTTAVKHITDSDLLAALSPAARGVDAVLHAAGGADPHAPWAAWHRYLLARRQARTLPPLEELAVDHDPGATIREANLVVKRDIKCWGGVRIRYPGEVDFSRNLEGSSNYGFHYFGWMAPLAGAWAATGNEKYARAFVQIFRQWYAQRDLVKGVYPKLDVIWYELGTGARIPVFLSLYFATLATAAARDPAYHRDMLKTALGHGRWLYDHETAFVAGNWQVTGARGLLITGLAFPELRESRRWVLRGLKYLVAHAERDVYADGCHKERAPHYHLGVARNVVSSVELVRGVPGIEASRRRLRDAGRRMLRWTATVMTPTGHSPVVGDSEYDVPAVDFLRGGRILRDPALLKAAAGRPERGNTTTVLEDSGFVVSRSGWRPGDLWFLLNYGPWGGGHSHAEALGFQLWCDGVPLAADCGRGVSYDDPLHKSWYVTPYAHNMVVVDGLPPSVTGRRGRLLYNAAAAGARFLGFEHAGYREQGVRHRRCFLFSERHRYLVVLDLLRSSGEHRYEWVLNTPVTGLRAGPGRAAGKGLTVLAAGAAASPRVERVRMCLPRAGGSTWGLPRGWGTNLRFPAAGGSLTLPFLLVPGLSSSGIEFTARAEGRGAGRLALTVSTPTFRDRWSVDTASGTLGRV